MKAVVVTLKCRFCGHALRAATLGRLKGPMHKHEARCRIATDEERRYYREKGHWRPGAP